MLCADESIGNFLFIFHEKKEGGRLFRAKQKSLWKRKSTMNLHECQQRLIETALFASIKHKDQVRKTGGAYISHPLSVSARLAAAGVTDLEVLQAAMLHDTVEDTETTLGEIEEQFGATVACYVGEVTDDKSLTKDQRKRLQVEHAKTASDGAFMIKMADAIDNLSDLLETPPPDWGKDRVKGYFVWKKAVFGARQGLNASLEADLRRLFDSVIDESDDEEKLLTDYYRSMAVCGETD